MQYALLTYTAPDNTAPEFVDMVGAYEPGLRAQALATPGVPALASGVYAQVPGPQFETPAEIRMLRTLGADVVGMSMAFETIAARHAGAAVLGLAVVTNAAAGTDLGLPDIAQVGAGAAPEVAQIIRHVLDLIPYEREKEAHVVLPPRQKGADYREPRTHPHEVPSRF